MDLRSGKLVSAEVEAEVDREETSTEASEVTPTVQDRDVGSFLQQIMNMLDQNSKQTEQSSKQIREEMRQTMEQNTKKVEEKLEQTVEKIRKEIKQEIMQMKKSVEETKENIEETKKELRVEIKEQIIESEEKTQNKIETVEKKQQEMRAEIKEIKNDLSKKQTNMQEKIQVVLSPGMLRAPESDIKFYGDKRTHPVVFLKHMNEKVREMEDISEFKKIVRPSLKGAAESWFDVVEDKCNSMEDFNDMFLKYYWGTHVQTRVRENLYTGRYEESRGSTREEYAMKKISMARYLEPQMEDGDIIKYIARHYPTEISDVIAIQGIDTVERLLEYLRRIDDIKPVRKNRNYGNNNVNFRRREDNQGRWNKGPENKEKTSENKNVKEQDRQSKNDNGHRRNWNGKEKEPERRRYTNHVEWKKEREGDRMNENQTRQPSQTRQAEMTVQAQPSTSQQDF